MTFREDPWGWIVLIGLCIGSFLGFVFGLVTGLQEFTVPGFCGALFFIALTVSHAISKNRW